MKILILSADGFEDSELLVPLARLREAGMQVDIGSFRLGMMHGKHGASVHADRAIAGIRPEDYDALLLPGGKAPAALREDAQVLALVRHFFAAGKPVAAICHGPQVLIAAGVLAGRTATAYRAVAHELKAAGALYRDVEVVVDGNLVTSRTPADLPAFLREFIQKLQAVAVTAARPAA
ncbi:MAG TPA: type 1 glutamine amidotransferase domain-containing protein [Acidiferrobacterales bacterium]|nr:type 1 glutamine amidotransferase domain-containing protein [Acidiferrobacterales bacterium]